MFRAAGHPARLGRPVGSGRGREPEQLLQGGVRPALCPSRGGPERRLCSPRWQMELARPGATGARCSRSQRSQCGLGAQSSGTPGCGLCSVSLRCIRLPKERHLAPPPRAASPWCGPEQEARRPPPVSTMKQGGERGIRRRRRMWEWALLRGKLRSRGLGPPSRGKECRPREEERCAGARPVTQ